jgi:hypothetical protein
MALIKDYYNKQFGVTIPGCYWKIDIKNGLVGGKTKLRVRMNCFKTKAIADTNKNKFADFDFDFIPSLTSGVNFIEQAYAHAKTLPQFSGAINA